MKTSWVIGIMILYFIIFGCEMMVTGGVAFSSNVSGNTSALMSPTFTEAGTGFWAIASNALNYLVAFVAALFLWSPSVFYGYMVWVWWFICLPVSIGMIFSIVTIIRGVQSG